MQKEVKIAAIVEARMTSSRLPGKVMLEADGKPMLYYLVERLKRIESLDTIVLATTVNSQDDCLESFAIENDIQFFRGSEDDVLSRVIGAMESVGAQVGCEITGDCPLIDSDIVEQCIRIFLFNSTEYLSNCHFFSYPLGMECQVWDLEALKRSSEMTDDPSEKEHVYCSGLKISDFLIKISFWSDK